MGRNLDLLQHNNSASNVEAKFSQTFANRIGLLDDPSQWEMAVTRFNIPISALEKMIIDPADYWLNLSCNVQTTASSAFRDCSSGNISLYDNTVMKLYNVQDFVENVNRAFARAHASLIDNTTAWVSNFKATVSASSVAFQTGVSESANIAVTLASTKNYYVRLKLSNFVENTQTGSELPTVNIDLTNPDGTVCRVASGVDLSSLGSTELVFEDGAELDQANIDTLFDYGRSYTPLDAFLKFSSQTSNGTWVLTISACGANTLDIEVDYSLEVYAPPLLASHYELPHMQPNLSVSESSGYFSLTVHERFIHQNMKLTASPFLSKILQLQSSSTSNIVEMPITTLTAGLDEVITFKQESPKVYLVNQIDRLIITSNSLPIEKDISTGNQPTFAITSFILPGDEIFGFDYIGYSTDSGMKPWRRYRLNTSQPLDSIDIEFKVMYKDGSVTPVLLEPSQSASCLLSFFRA